MKFEEIGGTKRHDTYYLFSGNMLENLANEVVEVLFNGKHWKFEFFGNEGSSTIYHVKLISNPFSQASLLFSHGTLRELFKFAR